MLWTAVTHVLGDRVTPILAPAPLQRGLGEEPYSGPKLAFRQAMACAAPRSQRSLQSGFGHCPLLPASLVSFQVGTHMPETPHWARAMLCRQV